MNPSILLIVIGSCICAYIPKNDIPENLLIYQNLTNISDEKLYDIYEKGLAGFYAETYPKFYYKLSKGPSSGVVSPIIWDVKKEIYRSFNRSLLR